MEEKKDKRGGVRNNAGRKKLGNGEKKVEIKFWVENKYTFPLGGIEKTKDFALGAVKSFNSPHQTISIQDLNQPTNQIKAITDPLPQSNVVHNTLPPKPLESLYNSFRLELKEAKTVKEIEKIMSRVKAEAMVPRDKMMLESYAKELSKEMYTD